MDLKKLLAETMELSGMSSEIPNIVAEDPSENMTEEQLEDEDTQSEASPDAQDAREQELPELSTAEPDEHQEANLSIPELFDEDTQSEASPDAQDAREQELPELSTAEPDEHQEANLSIPELFDEDTQQLEVRHPNPEEYSLPGEPHIQGDPDAEVNADLSVEQPEVPENLPLGSEEEPADPTPQVPENPRSTEPEIPAYGVAHPQDHQDAELETGQPDDAELQQLAVHGFANQADPEEEESSSPRPEGDKLDYASLLRDALDDPMEQMRQSFKNHVADYTQEQILLTQLYGTY